MKTYIYGLSESNDISGIRYVGATNDINVREDNHIDTKDNSKKSLWIQLLLAQNKKPILIVLEETIEEKTKEKENFWIEKLSYLNLLNGGVSTYYIRKKHLQDTPITIRFNYDFLSKLKKIAKQKNVNYQSLIKLWLSERLEKE